MWPFCDQHTHMQNLSIPCFPVISKYRRNFIAAWYSSTDAKEVLLHNCGVGFCQSPTTLWIGHVHTHTRGTLFFSMNKVNHIEDAITLVYTRLMMSISHCKRGLFHQVLLTAFTWTSMSHFWASSWFWSYLRCGIYMPTQRNLDIHVCVYMVNIESSLHGHLWCLAFIGL